MATPDASKVTSSDVPGAGMWAKQRARIETVQKEELREKTRREDVYRARLAELWDIAHEDVRSTAEQRADFVRLMLAASEDLAILIPDEDVSPLPSKAIPGSPQEVDRVVADLLSAVKPDPDELVAFMRSSVAPTIERLARADEGTPETRVDVVARVLFELRGSGRAAWLAGELYPYLQTQGQRSGGFYQTVLNLAVIVSAAGPEHVTESVFLYHAVLAGFRELSAGGSDGAEGSRSLVSSAASSLARILWRRARAVTSDTRTKRVLPVLRDLRRISAVSCSIPLFEEDVARAVTVALGLRETPAPDALAVAMDMAEMADSWGFGSVTTSDVEACAGVGAAASGSILRAVDFLYNAGISLRAVPSSPEQAHTMLIARMLVNAAGLRLALAGGQDLFESLVRLDGIDCAVNFMGTFLEYRPGGEREIVASLAPLAATVAQLVAWPPLQRAERRTDIERIERAATSLGIAPQAKTDPPELTEPVEGAIAALKSALTLPADRGPDVLMDTAALIGNLYGRTLVEGGQRQLPALLAELVAARPNGLNVLVDTYAAYCAGRPDEVDPGPAVAAGLIGEAEWQEVARRLRDPLSSAVPAILEFTSSLAEPAGGRLGGG
jgi:hypothetical protein